MWPVPGFANNIVYVGSTETRAKSVWGYAAFVHYKHPDLAGSWLSVHFLDQKLIELETEPRCFLNTP
jgi:hypothetical protein